MRLMYAAIFAIFFTALAGCNEPLNLTENYGLNWPVCQVHQSPMQPERISVGGEIVYYTEYAQVCPEEFPNHGGHRLNGEKENAPRDRDVIDFVCPKCNIAYEKNWQDRYKETMQK